MFFKNVAATNLCTGIDFCLLLKLIITDKYPLILELAFSLEPVFEFITSPFLFIK